MKSNFSYSFAHEDNISLFATNNNVPGFFDVEGVSVGFKVGEIFVFGEFVESGQDNLDGNDISSSNVILVLDENFSFDLKCFNLVVRLV